MAKSTSNNSALYYQHPWTEDQSEPAIIAVVIPAYKAEKTIDKVLDGIPSFIDFIIVIDDNSPDQTGNIVKQHKDSRIHLYTHPRNMGVGGAVLTGYRAALELGVDIVAKMDSDDQMNPAYLPILLGPILRGEADYTKGNRFFHLNGLYPMPPLRRIGNIGLSFLTKVASGFWNIFDPTNGYTAIHTSLIPLLLDSRLDNRYFFETNILITLGLNRAVVRDVPIPAQYGSENSSLSEIKTLFEFPWKLLKGFLKRILISYFIRDFGVISIFIVFGLILILFGGGWGIYNWVLSSQQKIPALTGTIMLAVVPFILGIQFLLQAVVLDVQNVPVIPIHKAKWP